MKSSAFWIIVAALLVSACKATIRLPVSREVLDLHISADQLVCHVRNISDAQRLSFHYGTSQQSFGIMATFRLIGDRFEITLVNDQRPFEYDLRAYDMSDDGVARSRAKRAFAAFKTALMEQPKEECRK
jgi:hypothetical protein